MARRLILSGLEQVWNEFCFPAAISLSGKSGDSALERAAEQAAMMKRWKTRAKQIGGITEMTPAVMMLT